MIAIIDPEKGRHDDQWEDEESEQELHGFQDRHGRVSDRIERLLMQGVIFGLVVLVLVQALYLIPSFRRVASTVEALEGIPASEMTAWSGATNAAPRTQTATSATAATAPAATPATAAKAPAATPAAVPAATTKGSLQAPGLTVVLTSRRSAPEAVLLVDGQPVATFQSATVQVSVKPGQTLAIDGTRVREPLSFRVAAATGLSAPAPGTTVTTRGDRQSLGKVSP